MYKKKYTYDNVRRTKKYINISCFIHLQGYTISMIFARMMMQSFKYEIDHSKVC